MFENQISRKTSELLENFDLTRESIFLNEISSNDNLDYFTKNFFEAEASWLIYTEFLVRNSNTNFDLSNFEGTNLYLDMIDFYKSKAKFEIDQFSNLISILTKLQLNFLIRPHHTLNWFVFRNEPTKMFNEINLRLNYFCDYKYLIDYLRHFFNEKGYGDYSKDIVTSAEFQKLLYKIDSDFIESIDFSDFIELCDSIFSYFGGSIAPVAALIIFLDDKGLKKSAYLLEKYSIENSIELITKEELLIFLENTESNVIVFKDNEILDSELLSSDLNLEVHLPEISSFEINDADELLIEELKNGNNEAEAEFIDEVLEGTDFSFNLNSDDDVNEVENSEIIISNDYVEVQDYSAYDLTELMEKLSTKIELTSKSNDYKELSNFNSNLMDLSYTNNSFKNEIIDFYKSL